MMHPQSSFRHNLINYKYLYVGCYSTGVFLQENSHMSTLAPRKIGNIAVLVMTLIAVYAYNFWFIQEYCQSLKTGWQEL
jgi:hypothetical protein